MECIYRFFKIRIYRIRNKLTKITKSNILEKVKKTKFGLEKCTEKNFKENRTQINFILLILVG